MAPSNLWPFYCAGCQKQLSRSEDNLLVNVPGRGQTTFCSDCGKEIIRARNKNRQERRRRRAGLR